MHTVGNRKLFMHRVGYRKLFMHRVGNRKVFSLKLSGMRRPINSAKVGILKCLHCNPPVCSKIRIRQL